MATDWGAYENSGGRGIRCGITATPGSPTNASDHVNIALDYLTQNNAKYNNDAQTLNLSLDFVGTINFTNDQGPSAGPGGDGVVTRGSRTYTYNYRSSEYGSSPGNVQFKSLLSGADNGVTPGVTITVAIPARPWAAPDAPTFQSANGSGNNVTVQWLTTPSYAQPVSSMQIYRQRVGVDAGWVLISTRGAQANGVTSDSIVDSTLGANRKVRYLVRAINPAGTADAVTNYEWTTPSAPGSFTRVTSGTTQQLSWTNSVGYPEYKLQLWESVNGGAWTALPDQAAGTTSLNLTGRPVTSSYQYRIQTVATSATGLASAQVTSDTSVISSPPAAPTGLAPNSDAIKVDPANPVGMTWTYHSTDSTAQTAFEIQHRQVGAGTWNTTGKTTGSAQSTTLSVSSYGNAKHIEWQVRTWGNDPGAGAWSSSATFYTADAVPVKYNLVLNPSTGRVEALTSGAPAGVGTANAYYYEQNYASATTSVGLTHNLGTKGLEIEFYDSIGVRRFGDITKTTNAISMTFTNAVAGTMIVYGAVHA